MSKDAWPVPSPPVPLWQPLLVRVLSLQRCAAAVTLVLVLGATLGSGFPALAHTGSGSLGGFVSGVLHPVLGYDHMLAMAAVGIWGAQMGGRAVWTLPVVFPLIMAVGGVLGVLGVPVPPVEPLIALSVFVLGAAIFSAWKASQWIALPLVAIFAIFHGYAHGRELPAAADPLAYGLGFVMATGLIHLGGIAFGLLVGRLADGWVSRAAGGAIALAGAYFLIV